MDDIRELYEGILKTTKKIKTGVMTELADVIPFSAALPGEMVKELDVLASIDGLATYMLSQRGAELREVPGRAGYVAVEIGGETYTSHTSRFPQFDSAGNSAQVSTPAAAAPVQASPSQPVQPPVTPVPVEAAASAPVREPVSEPDVTESAPAGEPAVSAKPVAPTPAVQEEPEAPLFNEAVKIATEPESVPVPESEPEPEPEPEPMKATIIGGEGNAEPVVAPMARAEMFMEEKRKACGELVFDTYRVSVCHQGSRAEEMTFMIAPLKIQKYSCPTVPIIVAVYYNKRMYVASSFDKNEDGKNLVEIGINDYYFICRGSFNDKGAFQSSILTTGISANQGDMVNILSHKHNAPTGPAVKNGHIKFRYDGEDGPGIAEAFPIEMDGDDFVIMTRCGEFVDYLPISKQAHGLNRAIIYDGGIKSEIVCMWDGDFLECDIMPI